MSGPIQISDGELAVMRLFWDRGALSSREIMEQLYPNCSTSDHATVHSLLKRLERKKLVSRDRRCHPHIFSVTTSQSEFAGQQLTQMADKVSDGSLAPFLSHLIQSKSLTISQIDELRDMLADYPSGEREKRKAVKSTFKKKKQNRKS